MKRKKLVVISHTEHYKDSDGQIKGWGSTVRELDFLADHWEKVVHVACLYDELPPASSLSYEKSNIEFVAIPPYGGKKNIEKFLILTKIPTILFTVIQSVKGASEVQLRLPTSMGLFLLPLFSFFLPRKFTFWVKYAGNWSQELPPLSYRWQRWWLKNNWTKCKVTINGFWDNQPINCLSFENPCLTLEEVRKGKLIGLRKEFKAPYVFTFVGRLETSKGVDRIIDALKNMSSDKIESIHFIGDGEKIGFYKEQCQFLGDKVFFHGFLNKDLVHEILSESHFFLLPSNSEGFPKVIAEAACYGVVPVVSDVGSIDHYVNETNGFLWHLNSEKHSYTAILDQAVNAEINSLKEKSNSIVGLAERFTFEYYLQKLNSLLLK